MLHLARRVIALVACVMVLGAGTPSPGQAQFPLWSTFPLQYVDARVLPRGLLQIGFLPSYAHYDTRFATDGTVQPLGADLSPDSAGSTFLPSLTAPELAVRDLTGNGAYRMTLGKVKLPLDADVRRFPFDLSIGLTSWLTVSVRIPQVRTRVQGVLAVDSTTGNVGWNQAVQSSGNAQGLSQVLALLTQLSAAVASLQNRITQGDYGCPGSAQCAQANALLVRAQRLLSNLRMLTGPPGSTAALPPMAPLASSPSGQAITAEMASVASQLQTFGESVSATLPLPNTRLGTKDVGTILTSAEFGYGLDPKALETIRIKALGDVEAGLRVGLLRGDRFRAVLTAGVRLPTGRRESPRHVFDLGTGDHQTDVEWGLEVALNPGRLGLSGMAIYTHQFPDQLLMRWAPPERPIALAGYEYVTERQLGDVFRAAAYPSLKLSEGFRVYGSVYYFKKGADSYSLPATVDPVPGTPSPPDVARGSGGQSLSIGGGIFYRAERVQRDSASTLTTLPVEAGLSYQAAFSGSGGLVPKSTMLNLYLRFYARLFGRSR